MKPEKEKFIRLRYIWPLIAVLVVFVYFFGLNFPLLGPDEPRYTEIAREMYMRGDWVTPMLGGFNWFEKPVLLYWLQIASFNIFGVSEHAARIGSALCGLGTIFSLWILARCTLAKTSANSDNSPNSENSQNSKNLANWIALAAASSIGMIAFSRGASFDIVLTFPLTASLSGFFIYSESGVDDKFKRWLSLFSFYFFIGVALLAKGLVGIVFPFAIVAFYYVLSLKFPPRDLFISIVWGTLVALAVASVWYVPVYMRNGWEFIDVFFIQHHFQRYTSNKYMHPQPFYFFFIVLPLMTFPWFPFFFVSLYKAVKNIFRRPILDNRSRLRIFAFAWMLVPLVFFTFSGSKLPGYILPSLPAAMILCGDAIYTFIGGSERRRSLLQATAFATFAVIVGIVLFVLPSFADGDTVRRLIWTADNSGFAESRVAGFDTVSHSAEFYAAGRLIRNTDGTQRKFENPAELREIIKEDGRPLLVLVPLPSLEKITKAENLNSRILAENKSLAVVAVRPL
jgi:4-amino-4-deoxy-L-arabinose transferase-like glycosyltransferase